MRVTLFIQEQALHSKRFSESRRVAVPVSACAPLFAARLTGNFVANSAFQTHPARDGTLGGELFALLPVKVPDVVSCSRAMCAFFGGYPSHSSSTLRHMHVRLTTDSLNEPSQTLQADLAEEQDDSCTSNRPHSNNTAEIR